MAKDTTAHEGGQGHNSQADESADGRLEHRSPLARAMRTIARQGDQRLPKSPDAALGQFRSGMVQAIDASTLLARLPAGYHLDAEGWRTVCRTCELVLDAARTKDQNVLRQLSSLCDRRQKDGRVRVGATAKDPRSLAEALARTIERAKAVGVGNALLERDGRAQGNAALPPTRYQVAVLIAEEMKVSDLTLQPRDAQLPLSDCVYAAMPHGGHASSVDRNNAFRDEPFAESSERTVIAAFKAVGYPAEKANNFFNKRTKRRSRAIGRKRRGATESR